MVELKKSQDIENNKEEGLEFMDDQKKPRFSKFLSFMGELIKTVFISLAIILPIRYFIIQPFYVKGASMEPNFYDKDYLIINEFIYRIEEPARGDIIVFKNPRNTQEFFIKRVIGLPYDKIKIYNNRVFLYNGENPDGVELKEYYLPDGRETRGNEVIELKDDEYYVLGDNRDRSLDSRVFGPIKKDAVVGKVWLRGWPLDNITIFNGVRYNLKESGIKN